MTVLLLATVTLMILPANAIPSQTFRPMELVTAGEEAAATTNEYWTTFLNISYLDARRKVLHTERTETGRYGNGNNLEVSGIAVKLVSEENEDETGCFPPFRRDFTEHRWIAVLKRGTCTFNRKIRNVLKLNASGVLIYDNDNANVLQSMKVEKFPIPSVFTYNWKGREIVNLIRQHGRVYLSFDQGSHCQTESAENLAVAAGKKWIQTDNGSSSIITPTTRILFCTPPDAWDRWQTYLKKNNFNFTGGSGSLGGFTVEKQTSVLFVSVSFIVLMLISLTWLIFYYIQRFRYIHDKDQLERRLCSQAKKALALISTTILTKEDLEIEEGGEIDDDDDDDGSSTRDACTICIETFRVADVVRILPCKHRYHKNCIDQWLLEKRTCPICKMDILEHYGLHTKSKDPERSDDDAVVAVYTRGSDVRREEAAIVLNLI